MFVLLLLLAVVGLFGAAATINAVHNDGYRAIPTRKF